MSRSDIEAFLPGLDRNKPNIARIYDYWLGGKDNFEADRAEAVRLTEIFPLLPVLARENRGFLARAVKYLTAEAGIRQFLDIGSGLPTAQNTHEVAQAIDPSCRIAYVDFDPVVISHARALLNTSTVEGRIEAVRGNLTDPAAILGDPAVLRLINSDEPVAVILLLILHFLAADEIRLAMDSLIKWMAPSSYVVASFGSGGRIPPAAWPPSTRPGRSAIIPPK
jgi:S-adenosyl methyltransferase